MIAQPALRRMSRAAYEAFEAEADERHAFYRGEVFALAGTTRNRARVAGNLYHALRLALKGKGCGVYGSDLRVRVEAVDLDAYPDVSVVCGEERFVADRQLALLNPVALFDVLSPSTERYDRGQKFAFYRQIPSLRAYVLVAQERRSVEVFLKGEDGHWTRYEPDAAGRVAMPPIGAVLNADDLYEGVAFDAEDASAPTDH